MIAIQCLVCSEKMSEVLMRGGALAAYQGIPSPSVSPSPSPFPSHGSNDLK